MLRTDWPCAVQLACATCMHAMLPPTLNAALRPPRPLCPDAPVRAYDALVATAHAALAPLLPAVLRPLHIQGVFPLSHAGDAGSAPSTPIEAPPASATTVAVLATGALFVLRIPPVDTGEDGDRPSAQEGTAAEQPPPLLAQLPVACMSSVVRDGCSVHVAFVWPQAYDRARAVELAPLLQPRRAEACAGVATGADPTAAMRARGADPGDTDGVWSSATLREPEPSGAMAEAAPGLASSARAAGAADGTARSLEREGSTQDAAWPAAALEGPAGGPGAAGGRTSAARPEFRRSEAEVGWPLDVATVTCEDTRAAEQLCVQVRSQILARCATLWYRGRLWWAPPGASTSGAALKDSPDVDTAEAS
jgi:hypothetical protein